MRRFKHSLSHYKLLTGEMGQLLPVTWFEGLPGDALRLRTSSLIRLNPLLAPVMHPVNVRFHWWFVPNRLIWPEANGTWENFITGGKDGLGDGSTHPTFTVAPAGVTEGSLADYLGITPGTPNSGDLVVSQLPFNAYKLIHDEFYRDQQLVDPVPIDPSVQPYNVAWQKDYFTSARPSAQVGPVVSLPLGGSAPVKGIGQLQGGTFGASGVTINESDGTSRVYSTSVDNTATGSNVWHLEEGQTTGFPSIYADLSQATGTSVIEFREAMALQRLQEARNRYGSRYAEWLKYYTGRSNDSRLQRPEYLAGGKQTIAFSEILQSIDATGATTPAGPLGRLGGHGIAAMRTRRAVRYIPEHGIVMCLMSVLPKTMYMQHLYRGWSRTTKEDYFQRELQQIGMQEVYTREVYCEPDGSPGAEKGETIFGYQDRYDDYKRLQSTVGGEFRSTLDFWHMARNLGARPALNSTFVTSDPTKRIHATQNEHALWCMVNHSVQARRMVQRGGKTRII